MANVIEGEAPETDEEISDDQEERGARNFVENKKSVHVDERVQQHWRNLAADTQTVLWRRSRLAVKALTEQKDLAHRTFEALRNAALSLRIASVKLMQLEDGLQDIKEAVVLLPAKFEMTVDVMKIQ